jgi:hypothetical protein
VGEQGFNVLTGPSVGREMAARPWDSFFASLSPARVRPPVLRLGRLVNRFSSVSRRDGFRGEKPRSCQLCAGNEFGDGRRSSSVPLLGSEYLLTRTLINALRKEGGGGEQAGGGEGGSNYKTILTRH